MSSTRSRPPAKTIPVSIGWAMAVPLVLWWPLTFVAVQLEQGGANDLSGLLYLPAAVVWLPMVGVTALVAWLVGRRLRNKGKPADERGRRIRGVLCGVLTLVVVPAVLLMLEQMG